MAYNHLPVRIVDLMGDIEKDASAELAPLLGKTEVDDKIAGIVAAINEVMFTMFAVGHIVSPDQVPARARYFFKSQKAGHCEMPTKLTRDILAKHAPDAITDGQIADVARWVKCKIMERIYASFFEKLRQDLIVVSQKAEKPFAKWNLDTFMVGKWQTLREFIRTTVAPDDPEKWFLSNMSLGIDKEYLAAFTPALQSKHRERLHKHNGTPLTTDALKSLLDKVGPVPLIGGLEEEKRAKNFTLEGPPGLREAAKGDMLLANIKLLPRTATRTSRGLTAIAGTYVAADAVGDGILGLDKTLEKYDPARGFKISTYGRAWIIQSMIREAEKTGRHIRLPSHLSEAARTMFGKIGNFNAKHGRVPTEEEIAEMLDLTVENCNLLRAVLNKPSSLDQARDPERPNSTIANTIADTSPRAAPDIGIMAQGIAERIQKLSEAHLTPKQALVMRMRFGMRGTETIINNNDISREQLEAAIAKMKDSAGKYSIERTGSALEVTVNPELGDILDIINLSRTTVLNAELVFVLNIPQGKHNTPYAMRAAGKHADKIKMFTRNHKLHIVVDPRETEAAREANNIVGELLKRWQELQLYAKAVLEPQGKETLDELNSRLQNDFGAAISGTKNLVQHTITLEVFDGMKFDHIGIVIGLTRERVRQIQQRVLRKLRLHLNDEPSTIVSKPEDDDEEEDGE